MSVLPKTIENRRVPREAVSFRAAITVPGGTSGRVLLVDLSPLGFMARGVLSLGAGDSLTIRLPAIGARGAVVRWSLAGRMGAEFEDPLAAHDYAHVLAAAPYDRPSWNEV